MMSDEKKMMTPNGPSPRVAQLIEESKSNNKSLLQLIFILTLVVSGYIFGFVDPSNIAKFLGLRTVSPDAHQILAEHPLIDGHNDLLILLRAVYGNKIQDSNFTDPFENGGMKGQFDLPRADKGQLGGSFWSAFMPCPADGLDFSDETYAPFVKATLEAIDTFNRLSEKYPEYFTLPKNAAEAEKNFRKGKLISPLAIEGLHQIGNSAATLRLYYELGVRYATLNWNCHNKYSDAAVTVVDGKSQKSKPYWHGVSEQGQRLVQEMNRLGMLVDLSHVSVDTMRDVLGGKCL